MTWWIPGTAGSILIKNTLNIGLLPVEFKSSFKTVRWKTLGAKSQVSPDISIPGNKCITNIIIIFLIITVLFLPTLSSIWHSLGNTFAMKQHKLNQLVKSRGSDSITPGQGLAPCFRSLDFSSKESKIRAHINLHKKQGDTIRAKWWHGLQTDTLSRSVAAHMSKNAHSPRSLFCASVCGAKEKGG